MAKTTYIVNPGYSLEDSLKQYREGNYPGAVLYGIHHFEENGYQLIFPQSSSTVLEVSKGASKWQVLKSQIKSEWKAAMDCRRAVKHGNVSLVYMPLMNFGSLLLIFRKLKLINRPVVACVHSQMVIKDCIAGIIACAIKQQIVWSLSLNQPIRYFRKTMRSLRISRL